VYCNVCMNITLRKLRRADTSDTENTVRRSVKRAGISPSHMFELPDQSVDLVIEFLKMESTPAAKSFAELVETCRRLGQLIESIKFSPATSGKQSAEAARLVAEINGRLFKYEWHPAVFGFLGAGSHFRVHYAILATSNDPASAMEQYAIQWIVDHIDAVDRIRRCHRLQCRKWFFAVTEHQNYCGDNCRQRDASQGESFKEKRRIYMKKYRSEEAERNARAKRLARGKSK
jgi:hypothetical protein